MGNVKSVDRILSKTAQILPDKTVMYYENESISYSQLDKEVNNLAQGLMDFGLKPNEKVALVLGNCPNFVRMYFAILRAAGTVVPLNPLYKADEIHYILNDAKVKLLIIDQELLPMIREVRAEKSDLNIIAIGGRKEEGIVSFEELLKKEAEPVDRNVEESDLAVCLYTSGTSGRPKGALLSHGNLIFITYALITRMDIREDDHNLCVIPLSHAFSQFTNMLMPIFIGGSFTILPRFIPNAVLSEIASKKISYFCAVPAMYSALLAALSQEHNYDMSSLRICLSGGAPLSVEIIKEFTKRYGIPLVEGSGPSEAVACIGSYQAIKPGSVGPALDGVNVKVVNDHDQELPQGEIGEFCVQGPNVMQGYLNLPEATAEALRGGWFHTGDLAKIDEEGYVYIVGRKKDMILVGGMNVYPGEVEQCLFNHPQVLEAAVIGSPDKERGEVPKAFIVLKRQESAEPKEFILYCRRHLANYKCPRQVVILASLPKNPTGKIDKKQLA
ncbi:long-chain-fatty-acid--CoA ligase [Desulfosporosinus meridiei]|uniref:Acyl-CoA synthetase (AMP-forming)/AMP-acid ligase II n=1 Tax=Desulfosporosinus meridiei (strain ATCC BAA-275 / DSM 13257 / KCTC 12902 / NCIMB 13706 / S10) TaxID=768704 RepID=J7J5J3_DESMD|nr:long-chain fatty acid--CoA ligase [Desulfosporosinus meridiei]AFQ46211.1 acyl-CoA synthetase (AMP-forming)/AMP-acid ligase II [Desulfosporosinus meridiei DSM 13257]